MKDLCLRSLQENSHSLLQKEGETSLAPFSNWAPKFTKQSDRRSEQLLFPLGGTCISVANSSFMGVRHFRKRSSLPKLLVGYDNVTGSFLMPMKNVRYLIKVRLFEKHVRNYTRNTCYVLLKNQRK